MNLSKQFTECPHTYEAYTKAGVAILAYGNFITIFLNFLILAFIVFQMVNVFNKAKNAVSSIKPCKVE